MNRILIGGWKVEWRKDEPHIFTISEDYRDSDGIRTAAITINHAEFKTYFTDEFLNHLKDLFIERHSRVRLRTLKNESAHIRSLFRKIIEGGLLSYPINQISSDFLDALVKGKKKGAITSMQVLRRYFQDYPSSPVFDPDLKDDAFPNEPVQTKDGRLHGILHSALRRATCIEILRKSEEAFENGNMDIARYSFINLAFSVYARSDSYRRIRVSDLHHDNVDDTFFLDIPSAKTRATSPKKIHYRLSRNVALLLLKQRQSVIDRHGEYVGTENIGKLALFPAMMLRQDGSWVSHHAEKNWGEADAYGFSHCYFMRVKKIIDLRHHIGCNVLRHTIGTQMAISGYSATTIQAVLKHATDSTCHAYIDLAFSELIDELSDAMRPAFENFFPVFTLFRSKSEPVKSEKAIYSNDIDTDETEFTGECGKDIQCLAAPLSCYDCGKFIPCSDADHSINLRIAEKEIEKFERLGTPFRELAAKAERLKLRIVHIIKCCETADHKKPY